MSTADQLVELMVSWIKQREECAEKLKKLAKELETLRKKCNAAECVGSSAAVVGGVALLGAGVATLLTGGLAAPFLGVAGAACSGAGVAVSVGTKITEHFMSSEPMEEAQKIENKSKEIADKIQHRFEQLKEEVRRLYPSADPEEVKGLVMSQIVGAIARQYSGECQFDLGKFYAEKQYLLDVGLGNIFKPEWLCELLTILSFFAPLLFDKEVKRVLTTGTKLIQNLSKTGGKTALKGGAMIVGGAVTLAIELPEMIDNWKDLIKKNHVTEASKSLRDTAEDILKTTRTMRKQFDDIKQELQTMAELRSCIESSNRSPNKRKKLIENALRKCENEMVKEWLRENSESEVFSKLVDLFKLLTQRLTEKKKKKNIHIIFVAHGDIEESMIPASFLRPLPIIEDVLLYSPWNCAIDANAAYGIATGDMKPEDRKLVCAGNGCSIPDDLHQPMNLPDHWNSMKKAGGQMIPNILVSTLRKPKYGAWKEFKFLKVRFGRPGRNRVVIPFILPDVDSSLTVPFSVVTFALSLVLFFSGFEATVHLAACLGKRSENTKLDEGSLKEQYACTIDETRLKGSKKTFFRRYRGLYRALKAVFS